MDFIDYCNDKQAAFIEELNPKKGDFVNLDSWFGDVWAEVLNVFPGDKKNPPRKRGMMQIAANINKPRPTDLVFFYQIRKVACRDELNMGNARIIYCEKASYYDWYDIARHPLTGTRKELFFGGFVHKLRYTILNEKGAPIGETKRIDMAIKLKPLLKNPETLRIWDCKKRIFIEENA